MKVVLADARPGSDFTLDAVWAGLVQKLGADNVIDWPPKDKHRAGVPAVTGDADRDYGNERQSMCYTPDYVGRPKLSLQEVNAALRSGEVKYFFVDERRETYELYCQTVAPFLDVPVVVVAGHDRFWNDSGIHALPMMYRNLKAAFVDNWRDEYDGLDFVYPMCYATNFDHLWDVSKRKEWLEDKQHDVFFMGYNSHPDRVRIVEHLLKKYTGYVFVETRPDTVQAFIPKREYFKRMAQSRVCINLRGAAECGKALRFYEIPYVGSYMLSQRFEGKQLYPFVGGVHCGYFDTLEHLDSEIQWALKNPVLREGLAVQGHHHALFWHTALARVDYVFSALERWR